MNADRQFTLDFSPAVLIVAIVAWLAIIMLAWLAWRRSGYVWRTGVLELLRVTIGFLALLTLGGPEWIEVEHPNERPVLVILRDSSGSMQTRDMLPGNEEAAGTARSRTAWLDSQLPQLPWSEWADKVEIVRQTFAGSDGETPADRATDIHAALVAALEQHRDLRAVVLLSDGDWNQGAAPVDAAVRLRVEQIPVFAVAVGSPQPLPDVEIVSLSPPSFSVVGKSLQIPFRLRSSIASDYEARVTLTTSDGGKLEKTVLVPAMGDVDDLFVWTPDDAGKLQVTLDVESHPQEIRDDNNQSQVSVDIKAESLRVLVVESTPRWEYRFLRNALQRDPGVEVSCLLLHPEMSKPGGGSGYLDQFPAADEELSEYDVIFLGDVGVGEKQLSMRDCERIKGLVQQQASGLILMPGMQSHQYSLLESELKELYPVELDPAARRGFGSATPSPLQLTTLGQSSLLTKLADTAEENQAVWQNLPGFHWRAPVLRVRAGSEVLAIDEQSRTPLLVTRPYGTGKVLFMGTDGAWRWRKGVEDKYHYRFWGQVARWMAYQRQMAEGDLLRLFYTPDRPVTESVVTLNATVLDAQGAPLAGSRVEAEVIGPGGERQQVRFRSEGEGWGLYTGRFAPQQPGSYQVRLACRDTSAVLRTEIEVRGAEREVVGKPARPDVLAEIAQVTRGKLIPAEDLRELGALVLQQPDPEPRIRRHLIWASPWWAATLVVLMGLFWTGRKMGGAI